MLIFYSSVFIFLWKLFVTVNLRPKLHRLYTFNHDRTRIFLLIYLFRILLCVVNLCHQEHKRENRTVEFARRFLQNVIVYYCHLFWFQIHRYGSLLQAKHKRISNNRRLYFFLFSNIQSLHNYSNVICSFTQIDQFLFLFGYFIHK